MPSKMSSLGMAIAAPVGAVAIAWSGFSPMPVPTPTELLAQSLYMRGTKIGGYTDDDGPIVDFGNRVITQTTGTPGELEVDNGDDWMTGGQVEYNGGFWPISQGGLNDLTYGESVQQGLGRLTERIDATDDSVVVYGYSQSAVIVSQYKAQTDRGDIVYVLVSNPTRPNGGILSRFRGFTIPIIDIPLSGPAPTTSPGWEEGDPPTTYDLAQQYDGWADFPTYPLNLIATANAILGIVYLHGNYETEVDPVEALAPGAANTDTRDYGDTRYYTVGTDLLPLLRPLAQIGVPRPVLLALDAPLRVFVETGYDRTTNPGESTPAGIIKASNPLTDFANIINAIPVGIDDGLEAAGYGRPLNTTSAGMYGVGGPEATPPPEATPLTENTPVAPDDSSSKQLTVSEPEEKPADENAGEDSAVDAALTKPQRPRVRNAVNFARSIADTVTKKIQDSEPDADATDSSESAEAKPAADKAEKSETSQPGKRDATPSRRAASATGAEDSPKADKTDKAADKPGRGGGYVGKHRKADDHKNGDKNDAPKKKSADNAGV